MTDKAVCDCEHSCLLKNLLKIGPPDNSHDAYDADVHKITREFNLLSSNPRA